MLPPRRGVVEAADLLLSRIVLPIRTFAVLSELVLPARPREATADFDRADTEGALLRAWPPIREDRPEAPPTLEVLPERATGCLSPVGVEGLLVPIEPPMRPRDRRSEPVPVDLEIPPELERMLEPAAGCFASVETDGLSILIDRDLEPGVGVSIRIDRLLAEDSDGVVVLMELPIRDLLLELIDDRLETETDGVLPPIELPIRDLLLGLLLIDVVPRELLLTEVLDEGPPKIEEPEGLEIVTRFDVDPLGLLPDDIVPERLGVDRLTDILLELLGPRADRLDDNEPEWLSADRLVAGILPTDAGLRLEVIVLGGLGAGGLGAGDLLTLLRLEVVVLDRLGVGGLLADGRPTLLRLDVIGLDGLDVGLLLTDDLLELLRLDIVGLEDLGVGLLVTDDLLELLRLDATDLVEGLADRDPLLLEERAETLALAAGADLATAAFWLELLDFELFLELLAPKTDSAAKANSTIQTISRKSKIGNKILSLYLSIMVSFLYIL